ncbi:Protein of unknown function, partial [Gryllus bimaculatus]
MSCCGGCC